MNSYMDFSSLLATMEKEARKRNAPVYSFSKLGKNEFQILLCTILSTRTRDKTTKMVCEKILKKIRKPQDVLRFGEKKLQNEIYGVGFYRNKARLLVKCAKILVEKHGGNVPRTRKELLELPGVGRKVANVVLVHAFSKDAIPVDVHVHRISNRLGIVKTKTPEETEKGLEKIVPKKLWKKFNTTFVAYGQTLCLPRNPKCDECRLKNICMYYRVKKQTF